MSKLGTLSEKKDSFDAVWYKILSFLSGEDLKKVERKKLRQNRKRTVEMGDDDSPAPMRKEELLAVIVAGLNEAQLMDDFHPDLLILSEKQYREVFDIGVGEDIDEPNFAPMQGVNYSHKPPRQMDFESMSIEATYSQASEGMLLVESDSL